MASLVITDYVTLENCEKGDIPNLFRTSPICPSRLFDKKKATIGATEPGKADKDPPKAACD